VWVNIITDHKNIQQSLSPQKILRQLLAKNTDAFTHLIPFVHGFVVGIILLSNPDYEAAVPETLVICILYGFMAVFIYFYVFGGLQMLVGRALRVEINFAKLRIAMSWVYLPFAVGFSLLIYLPAYFRSSLWSLMDSEIDRIDWLEIGGAVLVGLIFMFSIALALSVVSGTKYSKGPLVAFIGFMFFMLPLWLIPFSI